jgi:hypothetical protein
MEEHFIYVQGQAEPLSVSGPLVDQMRESLATRVNGAIILMQAARRLIMPMRSILAME